MFNQDLIGLHNSFELITQDEVQNMVEARSLMAIYYPKEGGRVRVVVKDIGEELFSAILLASLYNPDFDRILRAALLTADKFKKNHASGYLAADQLIEYFRIQDFSQLKKLYYE